MKAARLAITLLFLASALGGCVGAMQTKAHEPVGTADVKPTREDKHAGLVGLTSGFDLKTYRVIGVVRFPVSQEKIKDEDDRKMADRMPAYFQSELVRHLRDRTADVRREIFRPPYPTATGVVVQGLLREGELIEISAVAVLPAGSSRPARGR